VPDTNVVNPELIYYPIVYLGVPPSGWSFPKTGLRGTPSFFKNYSTGTLSGDTKSTKL